MKGKKLSSETTQPSRLDRFLAFAPIPILGEMKAYQVSLHEWRNGSRRDEGDIFCTNGTMADSLFFNVGLRRLGAYGGAVVLATAIYHGFS